MHCWGRINRNKEKTEGFQELTQAMSVKHVQTADKFMTLQAELIEPKKELHSQQFWDNN